MRKVIKKILSFDYSDYWNVSFNKKSSTLTFENFARSKNIIFETKFTSLKNLYKEIESFYNNFDVSTETYLWLDSQGHGTNGAPYDLEDVLYITKIEEKMYEKLKDDIFSLYNPNT